ncbi:unnamed protein product, partial [Prorocentrum cordatum]
VVTFLRRESFELRVEYADDKTLMPGMAKAAVEAKQLGIATAAAGRMRSPTEHPRTAAASLAALDTSAQQPQSASPEVATLQPRPRRAVPSLLGDLARPDGVPGSPLCGSAWDDNGDGAALCGLAELWDVAPSDHKLAALTAASSVSTSAGLTPSPTEHATAPGSGGRGPTPEARPSPARREAPSRAGRRGPAPSPVEEATAQSRKIFVGGVPQDMSQEDMRQVFGDYRVKKAWLQKCKTGVDEPRSPAASRCVHRGFGFIIFDDTSAIDQILGSADSKFVRLQGKFEGKQLEVKRAMSSNEMLAGGRLADQSQAQSSTSGGQVPSTQRVGRQAQVALAAPPAQTAQPAQAPMSSPWPTFVTPIGQQPYVPSACPSRPYMYPLGCNDMQAMVPQMPQVAHVPQVSTAQQMCVSQIASVAQMAYPQMGPYVGSYGCPTQCVPTCAHPGMVQQAVTFLHQPSGLPQNQFQMPQQIQVLTIPFAAAAAAAPAAAQ